MQDICLTDNYTDLFLADNDVNGSQNEIIFPIRFDGLNTTGYGGTTFLTHAPVGGKYGFSEYGVSRVGVVFELLRICTSV